MLTVDRFLRQNFILRQYLSAILILSLVGISLPKPTQAANPNVLSPHSDSRVLHLDTPLPGSILKGALVSGEPEKIYLAREILKKQKRSKGLIYSFSAAFITALAVVGQEAILRNANMSDFLMLQPLLMSSILFFILLIITGFKDSFKKLLGFFPVLWKSSTLKWYFLAIVSHQIFRNFIFFYTLPKITSTGINMIAAITVILTPVFELLMLGVNKFKWKYLIAYLLIFYGVIGYKMSSIESGILVLMVFSAYVLSAFESVLRKKIIDTVGDSGRTHSFTLTFLTWYYAISFIFWFSMWFHFSEAYLGGVITALQGGSWQGVLNFLMGPLHLIILLTAAGLVGARYLEQKTRTIPHFPVSFLEAIRHMRIVFTAIIVTVIAYLNSTISLPVFSGFTFPTPYQWFFIPIILGGVLLLAYYQRKEEIHKHTKEGNVLIGPNGKDLTLHDWDLMTSMMQNHYHAIKIPVQRARTVWNNFVDFKEDRSQSLSDKEDSDAELFWKNEIARFSLNERIIFERAKQIKGLRIGFDLDGVIVPQVEDYSLLDFQKFNGLEGVTQKAKHYRERVVLRPGILPVLLGLMVHNYVEIDTAASNEHVNKLRAIIPFFNRLSLYSGFQIKTAQDMTQALNGFLPITEVELLGKKKYVINQKMLNDQEASCFIPFKSQIKLPIPLGLDVLVEDHLLLKSFLNKVKPDEASRILQMRSYRLNKERFFPFRMIGRLDFNKYYELPIVPESVSITTEDGYEEEVLSILPFIDRLKGIQDRIKPEPVDYFTDIEEAV